MHIKNFTVAQSGQVIGQTPIREQAVNAAKAIAKQTDSPVSVTAHLDTGADRKVVFNPDGTYERMPDTMKTVNDYLNEEAFFIKDTTKNNEVLGLQINIFGERELSDLYGDRPVVKCQMETGREIYGAFSLNFDETLVLYIA